MKKKILNAILLGLSSVFASQSFSAESINGQEVVRIGTGWAAEGIYVDIAANNTSADGCGPRFRIEPTHPMLKEMISLLLSAFNTGAKVNLYVDGCVSSTVMKLKSVSITK